jgi:hypothetical protein
MATSFQSLYNYFRPTAPISSDSTTSLVAPTEAPRPQPTPAAGHNYLPRRLDGEALGRIASYLGEPERVRFSGNSQEPALIEQRETVMRPLRIAAEMMPNQIRDTPGITSERFMQLLGPAGTQIGDQSNSIRSFAKSQRAASLHELGLKINYLQQHNKQAATTELLAAFKEIPEIHRTPELTKMARVIEISKTVGVGLNPKRVVQSGGNVADTALFYGIRDALSMKGLRLDAVMSDTPGSAGAEASSGRNVLEVANEFGIPTTDLVAIRMLQKRVGNNIGVKKEVTDSADTNGNYDPAVIRKYGLDKFGIEQINKSYCSDAQGLVTSF